MNNVLPAIAIAFAIVAAPAGAADQFHKPGAASQPANYVAASGFALHYSFADILNFPIATDAQALLAPYSGVDVADSTPGASPSSNASRMDLWRAHAPGAFAARASGAAGREQGDGYLVSAAAAPEPSGGAMLLCGLTVLAFMARRKIQPVAG